MCVSQTGREGEGEGEGGGEGEREVERERERGGNCVGFSAHVGFKGVQLNTFFSGMTLSKNINFLIHLNKTCLDVATR